LAFYECSAKSAEFVDAAFMHTAELVHELQSGGTGRSTSADVRII
jgi:hypothetical protein